MSTACSLPTTRNPTTILLITHQKSGNPIVRLRWKMSNSWKIENKLVTRTLQA